MSWQPTVMPDDAPELAGSLVGTMLQGTAEDSSVVELSGNPGELLLWEAMQIAYCADQSRREAYAAEIEAARDWIFLRTCHSLHSLEVRDLLTEQARIARGES